ncbi:hypothetical protein PMAYCL1PPCAC_15745 [Pristionchus mayeri]|uniref:Uncharacterized protein n=1 Tax=Pristionchus mayeri TaxID=1317129 RepID=A0AAN5CJK9_9BILA|nr:hypothetical protein PMAYCL1PPCAC_15745 [Pristionchus mayeri]
MIRYVALLIVFLASSTARVIQPSQTINENDEDSIYIPPHHRLQMAGQPSIPVKALRECAKNNSAACPSHSIDGPYSCISTDCICDGRNDCPRGEDEQKSVCHYHRVHMREMEKQRKLLSMMSESSQNDVEDLD